MANRFGNALKQSEKRTEQAINGNPEQMTIRNMAPNDIIGVRDQIDITLAKIAEYGQDMKGAKFEMPKRLHRIIETIQDNLSVPGRKSLNKDDICKIALMEFVQNHPELCE